MRARRFRPEKSGAIARALQNLAEIQGLSRAPAFWSAVPQHRFSTWQRSPPVSRVAGLSLSRGEKIRML
jgi:hypothetical protein